MDNLTDDSFFDSVSYEEPPKERPRFTYNAGEVVLDDNSPKVDCCKNANNFRIYNRDNTNLVPRGICCVNCDTEYLDAREYKAGIYHEDSEVEVSCIESNTDVDTDLETSERFSTVVRLQTVILQKKYSKFKVNRYVACLSMVQPHRRYIQHQDPRVIDQLRPGDHIAWHRRCTLWHHLLIRENKGNGKCDVIHFNPGDSWSKGEVKLKIDFDFTVQPRSCGTAYKILYDESIENGTPVKLVLDRANSRLLEDNYNLFVNNCEHLVTFCKTGKRKSIQATWLLYKLFFLILRVVILSAIIVAIIIPQYTNDKRITRLEEGIELLIVLFSELILNVLPIVVWHNRLHRKMAIGELDRNRRIVEAILEAAFTVSVYVLHIVFLSLGVIKTFMSESSLKGTLHVTFGIGFGILGKIMGYLAGHFFARVLSQPRRESNITPRERQSLYGAVTVHRW